MASSLMEAPQDREGSLPSLFSDNNSVDLFFNSMKEIRSVFFKGKKSPQEFQRFMIRQQNLVLISIQSSLMPCTKSHPITIRELKSSFLELPVGHSRSLAVFIYLISL
jgi:hypothetical protein